MAKKTVSATKEKSASAPKKKKVAVLKTKQDAARKSGIIATDAATASPTLAAYLERIGAKILNFRTYRVKTTGDDGYTNESGRVIVGADGVLKCTGNVEKPSDVEQAAIERELEKFSPPTSIPANSAQLKNLMGRTKGEGVTVYPVMLRNPKEVGANIAFVQVRTDKDGAKTCVPWTLWSDGEWRAMSPDGLLPFFKVSAERTSSRIMVHEGPKSAMGAQAKADDKTHPWSDFLGRYEHWGIMGGAYNANTSNYQELHAHKPDEVVYVCDNDKPGVGMLQPFSRCAKGLKVNGLVFGGEFPDRFDFGDPMPTTFMHEKFKAYVGPELKHLMRAATWATEKYEDAEGKKRVRLLHAFSDQWMHTVTPEFFVHEDFQHSLLKEDEFLSTVAPYRDRCNIVELMREAGAQKQSSTGYRPIFKKPGDTFNILTDFDTGQKVLNLCNPLAIPQFDGDFSNNDVKPWLAYLDKMFADERDNYEVKRWVANFIARPHVRIKYGLLLISKKQGVGKTTLGHHILGPIIGRQNHSMPSATEVCGNYNGWLSFKRLVTVDEIFSNDSRGAYDILKSAVTENPIRISEKYIPGYSVENWAHFILTSNHWDGFRLEPGERRWLVPRVTESKSPESFWMRLHEWLACEKGHAKIVRWAFEFVKETTNQIREGESAPDGSAKEQAATESYSDGMRLVQSVLQRVKEDEPADAFVLDCDLRKYIMAVLYNGQRNSKLEKPSTIATVALGEGWNIGGRNSGAREWGLGGHLGKIISRDPDVACMSPAQLAAKGRRPINVESYLNV